MGENRKLDAFSLRGGFREFAPTSADAPTARLQRISVALSIIPYMNWNFRVMDVSLSFFFKSGPLGKRIYAQPLKLLGIVTQCGNFWKHYMGYAQLIKIGTLR